MGTSDITIRQAGADSLVDIRLHPERYPRLKDIPQEQAVQAFKQIVLSAYMYRGQDIDKDKTDFTARTLYAELMEEEIYGAKFVTMEEVKRAVKKAVLNDEELYGINVASLYKIILNYVRGDGHAADNTAHEIVRAKRKSLAENNAAATMLNVYAGRMAKQLKG